MNQKVIGDQLENDCHKDYTYEDIHVHLPETTHKFTKKMFCTERETSICLHNCKEICLSTWVFGLNMAIKFELCMHDLQADSTAVYAL